MADWRVDKHRYSREFAQKREFIGARAISSRMPRGAGVGSDDAARYSFSVRHQETNNSVVEGAGAGVSTSQVGSSHHLVRRARSPKRERRSQSPSSSVVVDGGGGGSGGGVTGTGVRLPNFLKHTASVTGKRALGKVIPASPGPRPGFPKFYPVLSDLSFKDRLDAAEEAEVEAALAAQEAALEKREAGDAAAARRKDALLRRGGKVGGDGAYDGYGGGGGDLSSRASPSVASFSRLDGGSSVRSISVVGEAAGAVEAAAGEAAGRSGSQVVDAAAAAAAAAGAGVEVGAVEVGESRPSRLSPQGVLLRSGSPVKRMASSPESAVTREAVELSLELEPMRPEP